jgi:DNA-binding response OmpR family regulator
VETPPNFLECSTTVVQAAVNRQVTGSNPVIPVMKILFLDDEEYRFNAFKTQNPNVDVDWAINTNRAIHLVKNNTYDVAYLDHDLGYNLPTGKDFVNYLVSRKDKIPVSLFICHSMNPVGRANMVEMLSNFGYNVIDKPYAWVLNTNDLFTVS